MKSNYVVTLAVLITLGLISLRSICHSSQYLYAAETTHATDAEVCESKLDLLDRVFDSRREARKNFTKTSKARGPKNLYDPYEPEAICISDERFGKTPRYAAFGDGPKFVCGVDLVAVQQVNKNETQNSGNQSCLVYSVGSNNDIAFEKVSCVFWNIFILLCQLLGTTYRCDKLHLTLVHVSHLLGCKNAHRM